MAGTRNIQDTIAGLLAYAEGADNPDAAANYMAKAEALMAKYSIERAELAAQQSGRVKAEEIIVERLSFTGIYAQALANMAAHLGRATGDVQTAVGKHTKTHYTVLVGYESDVAAVKVLIASLTVQMHTAQAMYVGSVGLWEQYTPMEKFKERRQFILSFTTTAGERIALARRVALGDLEPGTALAVRNRSDQVRDFAANMFVPGKGLNLSGGSQASRAAGSAAGRNSDTGDTQVGTRVRLIGT